MDNQTIKEMKYESECMQRHIDGLLLSLDNSKTKLYKLREKLFRECEEQNGHNFTETEVIWDMGELQCVRMECEYCGRIVWNTKRVVE